MTIRQLVETAAAYAGVSKAELARRIGTSAQNLGQRLGVGRFTQEDLQKIAAALGAEFVQEIRFPDGTSFK